MEVVNHAWYYVAAGLIFAWASFGILAKSHVPGGGQVHWVWICGVIGFWFAFVAGVWLSRTWVLPIIRGLVRWLPILTLVVFCAVLLTIVLCLAAMAHDGFNGAVTASLGLAMALTLTPSFLACGVVPGVAGVKVEQAQNFLIAKTVDPVRVFG